MFGPRGTGKTTWLKSHIQDAIYLDLLKSQLYHDLLAHSEKLEHYIPKEFKGWVIIDEVQRIPELLNEVHRLIEEKKLRFILTGSSARSLKKKGVNLLAGRALRLTMHPLTSQELGEDFNIVKILTLGGLPKSWQSEDPTHFLRSYIETYLREEVLQDGLVRNLGAFSRFLETASFSQGSVLNISSIGRESGLDRMRVENYFSILEDLLIGIRLSVFSRRATRELIRHQKFYFFDCGVYRSLRPSGPFDSSSEISGVTFETLCFQEIRALNDYLNLGYQIYFWRTQAGLEVDFVLYGPKGFLAFEIKSSPKIEKKDLKSLDIFCADYPEVSAFLIYGGSKTLYYDRVTVLPAELFFKEASEILKNPTRLSAH